MAHSANHCQLVVYPSLARTAAPSTIPVVTTYGEFAGAQFFVSVTAIVTAPSVTFAIEGYDRASNSWYAILTSAAFASVTTRRLTVHPFMTASANVAINDFLPFQFRVTPTHSNTNSITFSVGANLLP